MLCWIKKSNTTKGRYFLFNVFFYLNKRYLLQRLKVQFFQTGLAPVFTIILFPSNSFCRLIFCFFLVLLAVDWHSFGCYHFLIESVLLESSCSVLWMKWHRPWFLFHSYMKYSYFFYNVSGRKNCSMCKQWTFCCAHGMPLLPFFFKTLL